MTSDGQAILQSTLGRLLGFDDGAEDILHHLLTIESKADLSEYLSQLLGGNSAELDQFVENVCRHQKGESLVVVGEETQSTSHQDQETSNAKNAAVSDSIPQQKPQNSKASAALESRRYKQNHQGKKSRVPPPKSSTSNNSRKSPPPSSRTVGNSTGKQISKQQSNSSTTNPTVAAESPPASGQQPPSDRVVQKSHPKRGKAKKVCGCFGTKHNPLTNCLYCGRISCELEGHDFCAFCGYMVEEIKAEANSNDKAWIQKERLLRFDREFARRTQIFDDQADYQQHTSWLTEEERKEAEDQDEDRLQSLRRPKQTMNLAI